MFYLISNLVGHPRALVEWFRRWRRAPLQQTEGGGAAAQPPRRNRIFLFQHGAFAVANAVTYDSPTLAASPAAAPATRDKQRLGLS